MAGPFLEPPLAELKVSPLGVVPKKEPNKFRMIHHLSFPEGSSVNEGIDPELCSVVYTSFDAAIEWVRHYVGPFSITGSRGGSSGEAVAGGIVEAAARAVDGAESCLIWLMGHSYVFWGAFRAEVRPEGRQLGLARDRASVRWLGLRGMVWRQLLPEFTRFVRLDRSPDILVLHLGGNDLGVRPFRELITDIKHDCLRIWSLCPGIITVWSDIVPRKFWRDARSVERLNKARIKVNRAIGRFMARNGQVVVRHLELEKGEGAFWRRDGVHLNAVGTDLWALDLQSGVETALQLWRDARR
ncbi:uncharacterized protein RB166_006211 [Leptodactylus fuscus]